MARDKETASVGRSALTLSATDSDPLLHPARPEHRRHLRYLVLTRRTRLVLTPSLVEDSLGGRFRHRGIGVKTSWSLAGMFLLAGCATVPQAGIESVGAAMDGQRVAIRGELRVSGFDGAPYFHLCPVRHDDDFGRCLDLVIPEREASRHVAGDRHCAIASGRFIAFGEDTVGTGYLRSGIGMIEDAAVGRCD